MDQYMGINEKKLGGGLCVGKIEGEAAMLRTEEAEV